MILGNNSWAMILGNDSLLFSMRCLNFVEIM